MDTRLSTNFLHSTKKIITSQTGDETNLILNFGACRGLVQLSLIMVLETLQLFMDGKGCIRTHISKPFAF